MKSPVSHVNVIVVADRVMAIGGLPPSASTASSRCHTDAGCGARIVMRWTAGSMAAKHTRTYVRLCHERRSGLVHGRARLGDSAPRDREARGRFDENGFRKAVGEPEETLERAVDAEPRAGREPDAVAVGDRRQRRAPRGVELG